MTATKPRLRTPPRMTCSGQLELPLIPDPAPTLIGCECQPPTHRTCGHCTHCDTCIDCGRCAGSGCTCECEAE